MEILNPEKPKPKIYLPEVRAILENDVFLKWILQQLEGINDKKNTLRHSQRITNLGYLRAKHLKFSEEKMHDFIETYLAHDIGKTKTPVSILMKPWNEFTDEDRKIVSEHTREGKKILKMLGRSPRVYNPVLLHHEFQEKYYPEIDIEAADFEDEDVDNARLLAMIDVFDRCAFGATNIKPLPEEQIEPTLVKQFNQSGDEEIIDFLMNQYKTIKELSGN